jgi:hypothetical protein
VGPSSDVRNFLSRLIFLPLSLISTVGNRPDWPGSNVNPFDQRQHTNSKENPLLPTPGEP